MELIFDFLTAAGLSPSQSFTPNHSIFWSEYELRVLPVIGTKTYLQLFLSGNPIRGFENQGEAYNYVSRIKVS